MVALDSLPRWRERDASPASKGALRHTSQTLSRSQQSLPMCQSIDSLEGVTIPVTLLELVVLLFQLATQGPETHLAL